MILSKKIYSKDALLIAAQVLSPKANVYLEETKSAFDVTLEAKRKGADLAALEGEFGNELLNQEYRFLVGRFNAKISGLIVTQTLMAARGGEKPAESPAGESTPEFKKLVADLVRNAEAEVARTMPRKIADQGTVLPPAKEDAGV